MIGPAIKKLNASRLVIMLVSYIIICKLSQLVSAKYCSFELCVCIDCLKNMKKKLTVIYLQLPLTFSSGALYSYNSYSE